MLLHVTTGLLEVKELSVICSVTIVIARQGLNCVFWETGKYCPFQLENTQDFFLCFPPALSWRYGWYGGAAVSPCSVPYPPPRPRLSAAPDRCWCGVPSCWDPPRGEGHSAPWPAGVPIVPNKSSWPWIWLNLIKFKPYLTIGFKQLTVKEESSKCSHFCSNSYASNWHWLSYHAKQWYK